MIRFTKQNITKGIKDNECLRTLRWKCGNWFSQTFQFSKLSLFSLLPSMILTLFKFLYHENVSQPKFKFNKISLDIKILDYNFQVLDSR